jgi:hypothetical protein
MTFSTVSGSIDVATLWEFITKVKVCAIKQDAAEAFSRMPAPDPDDATFVRELWNLSSDPALAIKQVLERLPKLNYSSDKLESVTEMAAFESANNYGDPTHLIPIGEGQFLLACLRDFTLYQSGLRTVLACNAPTRNFIVNAVYAT